MHIFDDFFDVLINLTGGLRMWVCGMDFDFLKTPEFDDSDTVFGFPALFCVGSTDVRRKTIILDEFGAKRKKEGLPAAKSLFL